MSEERDAIVRDIAEMIAGLSVPVSLGMGRNGMLGVAYEPWQRLYNKVGGGWASAEEIEANLREKLETREDSL